MPFEHKIDKKEIPTIPILGVNIAAINLEWLIDFTKNNIHALTGDYICVSNVHTTVLSCENKPYMSIQNGGIMAIPDGGPLTVIGRKCGAAKMCRITGPDYMGAIMGISAAMGWKHFFYGSTQDTLDKLKNNLEEEYPGIHICGMYSPPFRALTCKEDKHICDYINNLNPDFLWVGLGAPKQELWMSAHQGRVRGLMVGVGAAFDYYAGNIKRAPSWMQKSNLEWFYRLLQDPLRLWKRYLSTNMKFLWFLLSKKK